jgi:hypothetical protein
MSENPFGFGGMFDPDDLNNAMRQFAEQAQESQSVAFADNAIHLAVQMTTAAIAQITPTGSPEEQAAQLRAAITVRHARASSSGSSATPRVAIVRAV